MEPTKEPRIRYILNTTIDYTSEKFDNIGISLGWFVKLIDSGESFYISDEKPDLDAGDKVKIILEKVES